MPCIGPNVKLLRESTARSLVASTCSPTMEISAVFEKNSLHFRVQCFIAHYPMSCRQTYPENHWNKEVYQGIAVDGVTVEESGGNSGTDHGHFVICCLRVSGCSSVTRLGLFLSSFNVVSLQQELHKTGSRASRNGPKNNKRSVGRNRGLEMFRVASP
jgi:hypothetical protein